jgi:hypothetical protein
MCKVQSMVGGLHPKIENYLDVEKLHYKQDR